MKFMPKKPDWTQYNDRNDNYYLTKSEFNDWWEREIKPIFENAIEVYGDTETLTWDEETSPIYDKRALLIKVESIKEQTSEDLVKKLIDLIERSENPIPSFKDISTRFKALEKKKKKKK